MRRITPATDYFRSRGYQSVTAATPYADLLHRSAAFGLSMSGETVEETRPGWDLAFETSETWAPRRPMASRLVEPPSRYVDGAARASLIGWGVEECGGFSAVVGGVVGAMAGRIVSRKMVPEEPVRDLQHARLVIGYATGPMGDEEIKRLSSELREGGAWLRTTPSPGLAARDPLGGIEKARIAAHTQVTLAMQELERAAIQGGSPAPDTLTVVDGNLGSHTTAEETHTWPLVGVVKRHHALDLPHDVSLSILGLEVGERTPMALMHPRGNNRPPMVTWYQKIRGDYGSALNGVIRVEVPFPYFQSAAPEGRTSEWTDSLSLRLFEARATRDTYSREDCSLHPVLLIEDRLHARAGRIEWIRNRVHRLLDIPLTGGPRR